MTPRTIKRTQNKQQLPEVVTRCNAAVFCALRVGSYFRRSQGLLRHVDVEGVAWEVMWKHNKSEFQRGLIYLLGTCISKMHYWLALVYHLQVLWLHLSQFFSKSRIVSESPQSHPTASQFSTSLYSTSHLVPLTIGHFLSPTLIL